MNESTKTSYALKICPHLGIIDDESTPILYVSDWNSCYRCKPLNTVSHLHQENYCLSGKYAACPVMSLPLGTPLPRELHGEAVSREGYFRTNASHSGRYWSVALGILVFLVALGGVAYLLGWGNNFTIAAVPATDVPIATASPSLTPEPMFDVPTMLPTNTPAPTMTATLVLSPTPVVRDLDVPFGGEYKFAIHIVADGDTLDVLAREFLTTPEAIRAINYQMRIPLWVGKPIVIPVGFSDVSLLPTFEPHQVSAPILLADLAAQQSVDIVQLAQYNDLPEQHEFPAGAWVVLPR